MSVQDADAVSLVMKKQNEYLCAYNVIVSSLSKM